MTRIQFWLPIVFVAGLSSVTRAANPQTNFTGKRAVSPPSTVTMPALIEEYSADEWSVNRFYDLPWSEVRFDRLEQLYRSWQARLTTVDFAALDPSSRVDYLLLRNEVERSLAGIARDRGRLTEMEPLLEFRRVIAGLERARWSKLPVDGQAAATQVAEVVKQVKQLKERLEKGRTKKDESKDKSAGDLPALSATPALALRTAAVVDDLRKTLHGWYEFYGGYQPEFQWWLKTPEETAGKQLEEYAKFLREEIAGQKGKEEDPLVGDPVGTAALAEEIRFEFLPYTAEKLIAIGERELAWCEAQRETAAQEMGCGTDWQAALAKVKADFAPPGQQDELVTQTARAAIAFTKQHQFATVPALCEETWRLAMMSPETLKTIPYAAYNGQNMMVAYAREDMKQEDKLMVMRGNNRSFTHLTVMHELIPGHHLQAFQAARHDPYRRGFSTPFYTEGWALYCELRFWDMGWAKTPQERLGMLFWRMHRAARIIVSLKFHLGQMKPDEMVDFLVNRIGHERFGATSEVRRFIRGSAPLYQAGYMIGGKQLVALHDELVPAKLTEQQFSDAVLAMGPIPIELLRDELRQLPLTRDSQPIWRFAGDKP